MADQDPDVIWSNSDWDDEFTFYTDYTSPTVNTPADLSVYSGASAAAVLKADPGTPFELSTTNGFLIIQDNAVILHVQESAKTSLPLGILVMDMVFIKASGARVPAVLVEYDNQTRYAG